MEGIKHMWNRTDARWFGIYKSAWIEMFLFFAIFFAIDYAFLQNDRMVGYVAHPFWILIVLMCVQYGTAEGIVATALSVFLLYVGNMPTQKITQTYFDYQFALYKLPFLWVFATLVLGELQGRKTRKYERLCQEHAESTHKAKEISYAYEVMKGTKERLETRLAGQLRSSVATYQALKSLEETKPARILLGLEDVVKTVLRPKKFSIYSLGKQGLEAAVNVGWDSKDLFMRRFPQDSTLFAEIVGSHKMLSVTRQEDAVLLGNEGLLASPLIDSSTQTVFGMLKIESLEMEQMTLSNIESFRLICEGAGIAYANALKFQELQGRSIFEEKTRIYSFAMLHEVEKIYHELGKVLGETIPCVKISLRLSRHQESSLARHFLGLKKEIELLFGPKALCFVDKACFEALVPYETLDDVEKQLESSSSFASQQYTVT